MPLLIDKLLGQLAMPLGSALGLAVLALLLLALRRRGGASLALITAIAWLWLWSTPLAARWISDQLAADYPPLAMEELPLADAIVLLGGGVDPPAGNRPWADLGDAADRVWHAARLYRAGLAPRILLSGGNVWASGEAGEAGEESEADAMLDLLNDLGVPRSAVILEGDSRTTRQNAVHSAALIEREGWQRVLLVTSATHMRRSLACFQSVGVDAVAAATDHQMPSRAPLVLELLPDADALDRSTRGLREYLGLWVYRLRGWA
ncbi:MAG TPA: YdcF family protein [Pseudomonadales bacterium]|nr:YdcF family protein [Pseudomonadales bacterium]